MNFDHFWCFSKHSIESNWEQHMAIEIMQNGWFKWLEMTSMSMFVEPFIPVLMVSLSGSRNTSLLLSLLSSSLLSLSHPCSQLSWHWPVLVYCWDKTPKVGKLQYNNGGWLQRKDFLMSFWTMLLRQSSTSPHLVVFHYHYFWVVNYSKSNDTISLYPFATDKCNNVQPLALACINEKSLRQ